MKISKNIVLVSGAIGLGLVCFFGANYYLRNYLSDAEARLAATYKTSKIIVAREEIKPGTILSSELLAARAVPQRFIPSNAIMPEELDNILGQRALSNLKPGDPIDKNSLERAENANFSTTIANGERAITFPVDEISSISGMLIPGDIIDLMYTGKIPTPPLASSANQEATNQAKEQIEVRLILQAVQVLATGKMTKKKVVKSEDGSQHEVNQDFTTVTLKVTPQNSQQILLAQKVGQLTAILRNPGDKEELAKLALDELSFKQSGRGKSANPADNVDFIIGGMGNANVVKMPIPENTVHEFLNGASGNRSTAPTSNAMDVKSRLGLTPPSPNNVSFTATKN